MTELYAHLCGGGSAETFTDGVDGDIKEGDNDELIS